MMTPLKARLGEADRPILSERPAALLSPICAKDNLTSTSGPLFKRFGLAWATRNHGFARLRLSGAAPNWRRQHLKRLYDWCRANGADYKTIEGQLEFIAFDLSNDHETIGMALKLASTREEAQKAFEPYVRLLNL